MRTRDEQIKPWGYISPFAKKSLQDREKCDLTITRKSTVSATMALYTEEHILEAERRAEQRVRAEIARDSERLDWISRTADFFFELLQDQPGDGDIMVITGDMVFTGPTFRSAIDAARVNTND